MNLALSISRKFYREFSRTQKLVQTHIDDLRRFISQEHLAPDSRHSYLVHLEAFFNWCVNENIISSSPLRDSKARLRIEKPKTLKRIAEYWTFEEIALIEKTIRADQAEKVVKWNKDDSNILWVIPAIWFAASTGFRRAEIKYLRWGAINFEKSTIAVKIVKDKAMGVDFTIKDYQERSIYLNAKAREVLESLPNFENRKPTDYVFAQTYNGKTFLLNDDRLSKYFKRYARMAGFYDSRNFHGLRKTYATHIAASVGREQAHKDLGHSDYATTDRYIGEIEQVNTAKIDAAFSKRFI